MSTVIGRQQRIYDYYAMLGVDRRALHKQIAARFNTLLIYQSPQIQAIWRRAFAVLSDETSRSLLNALLDHENSYVIKDSATAFIPEGLAGQFWASSMDAVGRAYRVRQIRSMQHEGAKHTAGLQSAMLKFAENPKSDRNRRSFIAAFDRQLELHREIAEVFLSTLGISIDPTLNGSYRQAVDVAIDDRKNAILDSLHSEVRRLLPPDKQNEVYEGSLFHSFARTIDHVAESARLSADQVTACASELAAATRGRYLRRAQRDAYSRHFVVLLSQGEETGWAALSLPGGPPKTPIFEDGKTPRPIDLCNQGFDVITLRVKPYLVLSEVLSAVASRHAELFAEQHSLRAKANESPGFNIGLSAAG